MEEEEKIEMTDEEFRKLVLETLNQTLSVEEAINEQKENEALMKESFKLTKEICYNVRSLQRRQIIKLHYIKLQMYFLKLLTYTIGSDHYELVCDIIDKINDSQEDFRKHGKILNEIKECILKLEKYRTDTCNYNICKLIMEISKNEILQLDILGDYVNRNSLALKGITYYGTTKNQDELITINNTINDTIKILGLSNNMLSDK